MQAFLVSPHTLLAANLLARKPLMLWLCRLSHSPRILTGRFHKQCLLHSATWWWRIGWERHHFQEWRHLEETGSSLWTQGTLWLLVSVLITACNYISSVGVCISLMEDKWLWGEPETRNQLFSIVILMALNSWGLSVGMVTMVTRILPWQILGRRSS